jgi:hypothetical protein
MRNSQLRCLKSRSTPFRVEASNEETAIKVALGKFRAQIDPETCVSFGLGPGRPPTVGSSQRALAMGSSKNDLKHQSYAGAPMKGPPPSEIVRQTLQHASKLSTSHEWPVAREALSRILANLESRCDDPSLEMLRRLIKSGDQKLLENWTGRVSGGAPTAHVG